MRHGDVLVFASDGVWDNLSAGDVLSVVGRYMTGFGGWAVNGGKAGRGRTKGALSDEDGKNAGELEASVQLEELTIEGGIAVQKKSIQAALAVAVAGEAKRASVDQRRESPFGRELKRHYPQEQWDGGKVDDICVVVALIVQDDASA